MACNLCMCAMLGHMCRNVYTYACVVCCVAMLIRSAIHVPTTTKGQGMVHNQVEMKMIASDTNKYYYIDQGYGELDELTE